ncbi:MAG: hypothetical protein GY913_34085 [Proteobacteria bacterium]|nr:hypothetical protein [Pseudomonadota bacterium]MCP4921959.1 hypothetical protein [Pseudomonadota bacterium]
MILLLACTSADLADSGLAVDTSPPEPGRLALRFQIDTDYRDKMDEPADGVFYGSFWDGEDVDNLGPFEGTEDLGSIEVEVALQDVEGGGPTEVLFTSEDLPGDSEVVVLGFLDSDFASGDTDSPERGEPVTFPSDNRFDVVPGETTEAVVYFGLLSP